MCRMPRRKLGTRGRSSYGYDLLQLEEGKNGTQRSHFHSFRRRKAKTFFAPTREEEREKKNERANGKTVIIVNKKAGERSSWINRKKERENCVLV